MHTTVDPPARPPLSTVGRVGHLELQYRRRGDETILTKARCCSPWHLLPPIDLNSVCCTLLVNPSGGLVGGDRLTLEADLGAETHVLMTTPSANRVYRSPNAVAVQSVQLHLDEGAVLEWIPELTIPFAGSRFRQRIAVRLRQRAILLLWDSVAAGRIARGERWCFGSLENEILVEGPTGRKFLERYCLETGTAADGGLSRRLGDWNYVGSLLIIGDGIASSTWETLERSVMAALDAWPGRVLGGLAEPAAGGRLVKVLARTAPDLHRAFQAVWSRIRELVWKRSVPELRRY